MTSTRCHSYDLNFKLKIIAEAEAVNNNREIAREYGLSELMVRKWRTNQIKSMINFVCLLFILLTVFIYFLTSVYLGNLEKLYFVARKYSVIRRTPSFKQILIKQAYFSAPYKWINKVLLLWLLGLNHFKPIWIWSLFCMSDIIWDVSRLY